MKEIWKDIEGYEGLYQVSNLGRVKSLERISPQNHLLPEKILKPGIVRGYLDVQLSKDGKRKNFLVHRLVGSAFIPNSNNLETVNHIDYDKTNNKVSNLEWMTIKDNKTYSSGKLIKCVDLQRNETTYFSSIREASNFLNISHSAILYSMYKSKTPYKKRFIFSEDK